MEKFMLENDIKVFCVTAKSFPEGITEAHEKLHSLVSHSKERKYFGVSRPNENGIIIYKAAAEELSKGETEKLNCESFLIKKGEYISLTVKDYIKDLQSIGPIFQQLLSHPSIDPQGACIEWYFNEKDVRCMVRLVE